ncbi:ornithine cyclodeaminase family protein [Oceanospirillum sediminis]|uniref:Ornithine cyclodeaminase family protein n=1 Tax=Oceanospirillum sediminis TaxID=2760088 RepID=A0A839IK61_9GAMM|nr:ornithine cyclodeaminase family protein [Oceanospirillum sediminis]MBB1485104.1 ornithine cyclodeaminase family protein [Oceanospirillum sediminis]
MQIDANAVCQLLPWPALIDALEDIFIRQVGAPVRHHHTVRVPGEPDATLLLMPAWLEGEYLGVKQVNVFPGNNARSLPGLTSHYTLSCGKSGRPLAQLDGNEITARRTAAASAMASRYLSREDTRTMLMVGAGRMGQRLIPAHMSVRPIDKVLVWDRAEASAQALVNQLKEKGVDAEVCLYDQLRSAASDVDLISCATMATTPLIQGQWLKPGTHLDLVGSFTPDMREADNDVMTRGNIFVDTRAGALSETGDLISPIKDGVISEDHILAEFSELCSGRHSGRSALDDPEQSITVFKSVGDSREDLAAAILAYQRNLQQNR